jgi:hypothetical protein
MSQFFICLDNPHNVARCIESQKEETVITMAGAPADGGVVKIYTGIVQSVDHDSTRGWSRHWLVTLKDAR